MKYLISILFCMMFILSVKGQSQSQYNNYIGNQGLLNPAYNGSRDVISGLMVSRNQWVGMNGAPMNQALNVHGPIEDTDLGVGLVLENDHLGFSNIFNFMGATSYKLKLDNQQKFISFGLQMGLTSSVYDGTKAITNTFGDPMFLGKESNLGFNFGVGTYFYNTNYFAGFSIPKFFNPTFDSDADKFKNTVNIKNLHSYWYGGYIFTWGDVKVKPTALFRTVIGAPLTFDLTANVLFVERLWVGLSYRSVSNMVVLTEYIIDRNFTVRYSFDYTFSDLNTYGKYGSHEIGLQFDFSFNKRPGMRSIRYF